MPHREIPAQNRSFARRTRREMPDAEFRLWCELRNRGLGGLRFRRQQPIGRYIVDFCCPAAKLIVEVDGDTLWLEAQGYLVVRFWTNEVMHDLDGVCAAILAASRGEWRNVPFA